MPRNNLDEAQYFISIKTSCIKSVTPKNRVAVAISASNKWKAMKFLKIFAVLIVLSARQAVRCSPAPVVDDTSTIFAVEVRNGLTPEWKKVFEAFIGLLNILTGDTEIHKTTSAPLETTMYPTTTSPTTVARKQYRHRLRVAA